jgi:hypothetical protein
MKFLLTYIFTLTLAISSITAWSQTTVLNSNDLDTYYEETLWGPEMRHYANYYVRYGMATPTSSNNCERERFGGTWSAGFTYKLKILSVWDMGIDLAYENEWHRLNTSNIPLRSLNTHLLNEDINRTYQNNLMGGIYTRFYFNKNRDHRFGTYIDLGAYYSWVAGYGIVEKKNDSNERIFLRTKSPDYLNNQNYGVYMRAGWNQIAIFARYNFADVFNNNTCDLTPLSIGLQMNLVMF